jgi:hypothetical protein
LKEQQDEVRKRQYEHFSSKLKEEAAKRAEEEQKQAEEKARRLKDTGETCSTKSSSSTLPPRFGGGDRSFSHMNTSSSSSRSVVRKVQPRQQS